MGKAVGTLSGIACHIKDTKPETLERVRKHLLSRIEANGFTPDFEPTFRVGNDEIDGRLIYICEFLNGENYAQR